VAGAVVVLPDGCRGDPIHFTNLRVVRHCHFPFGEITLDRIRASLSL
jgi:hypothetical protein